MEIRKIVAEFTHDELIDALFGPEPGGDNESILDYDDRTWTVSDVAYVKDGLLISITPKPTPIGDSTNG